jgi:hypothetical protein
VADNITDDACSLSRTLRLGDEPSAETVQIDPGLPAPLDPVINA